MTTIKDPTAMTALTQAEASDLFRAEPSEYIDVGGAQVAYRSVGSGPDVLFVHGWPVSGATFRLLLPYLAPHVTCHLIDLPGAGSSRFDADSPLSVDHHIDSVKRVIDHLAVDKISLVGHNSGGMVSRHATIGDPRLRGLGLINTEPPEPGRRFSTFVGARHLPGFQSVFGWLAGQQRVRRIGLALGDLFADSALLDGEFDEFFLTPLNTNDELLAASFKVLKSFDMDKHVHHLASVHRQIDVPVQLVWGDQDPFFPIQQARDMVSTFANAELAEIKGAGLFSHEENPAAVAAALLPTLTGTR